MSSDYYYFYSSDEFKFSKTVLGDLFDYNIYLFGVGVLISNNSYGTLYLSSI